MRHQHTDYWDRGVQHVVGTTGAGSVMDAKDIEEVLEVFQVRPPIENVLDVGCGTGRVARLCRGYLGVDIAPSAVEYCRQRGLAAELIGGVDDLPAGPFEWVLCLSVFTHVGAEERERYLRAFAARARRLLVDIIPGTGLGDVALWTADPDEFARLLAATGWWLDGTTNLRSDVGNLHSYHYAEVDT